MKIPIKTAFENRPMPNILLIIFGPRSHISVNAVIDTGSHSTIISYKDAELLQIPFKHKETIKKIQGISSGTADMCECDRELKFLMKKENGEFFKVPKNKALISKEKGGANITIIGMDFLKENNLSLYYDPNNNNSYLQITDDDNSDKKK